MYCILKIYIIITIIFIIMWMNERTAKVTKLYLNIFLSLVPVYIIAELLLNYIIIFNYYYF